MKTTETKRYLKFNKFLVSSECWESFDYIGTEDATEAATGSDNFTRFRRTNSYPKENASRTQYVRHDELIRLKKPMWISPNIEVKIADLGNACWEVC